MNYVKLGKARTSASAMRPHRGKPGVLDADRLRFDAVGPLSAYAGLFFLIPARWVLPGLGAAGRPASLFGLGLFALWGVVKLLPNLERRRTLMRWVLLVNGLILSVSYGLAYDRGVNAIEALSADRAMIELLSVTGVVLVASEGLPTYAHFELLAKRIVWLSSIVVAVGIVQFVTKFDPYSVISFPGLVINQEDAGLGLRGAGGLVRVRGPLLHPVEFSVVMAMVTPLAIHLALHEQDRGRRQLRYLVVSMHLAGAALSVSRSAVVSLAAASLVMVWGWSPALRVRAGLAGVAFLAVTRSAVPGLLGTVLSLFRTFGTDPSITNRRSDYAEIAPYVAERPLFGRGIGTFVPSEYILLDNAYLGRLVSTGYLGLAALLLLLFAGLRFARRCMKRQPDNETRHLGLALFSGIFAGLISGALFDLYFFPAASGILMMSIGMSAALGTSAVTSGQRLAQPDLTILNRRLQPGYSPGISWRSPGSRRPTNWLATALRPRR